MLPKLSIKARLVGGLIILSVLATVAGVGAIASSTATNTSINELYQHRIHALSLLERIKVGLLSIRSAAVTPDQDSDAARQEITRLKDEVNQAWSEYASVLKSEVPEGPAQTFVRHWRVASKDDAGPHAETDAALSGAIEAARLLTVQQQNLAGSAYQQTQADYALSVRCAVIVMLVSLMTAIAIGISLVRSISSPLRKVIGMAEAVASGDLTYPIDIDSTDEIGQLADALGRMKKGLEMMVADVRQATEVLLPVAEAMARDSVALATRNEAQVLSLATTAASMEELTSTVQQNADNAQMANSVVNDAAEVAIRGGDVVGEVVNTMGRISDASTRIVDIITVIDNIAFQTNLLALNAAVEAARAGEQGRGFAVVAGEVRNLAQRAAIAAKEIKALIQESVAQVQDGRRLVGQAGDTIGEIVSSVRRVNGMVREITLASSEQSSGIGQISKAIVEMDNTTQHNAVMVQQAATTAEAMRKQALKLAQVVSIFKLSAQVSKEAATVGNPVVEPGRRGETVITARRLMSPTN